MGDNIFQVNSYEVLGELNKRINEFWAEGKNPYIEIRDHKEDRSSAQNRTMHKWFKDISRSTKHELWYETGRCKERYFLPLLKQSDRKEARQSYWVAMKIKESLELAGKPDAFYETLYSGITPSTRFLNVKEFSIAMEHMWQGESQHNLTDPSKYGWNFKEY